tara:strand:- start:752 stop:1426 length:675 start_codon:yes stop_codon:yes gene_type:complete
MQVDTLNRLRLTFNANGPLRWVGHLDLVRTWERAIRRSGLRLAYSKGYNPHPRIALAAPLAVGISGQNELMDIWLENDILPSQVQNELSAVLSPGLSIQSTELVALDLPPMQSLLKSAIYEVSFNLNDLDKQQITESIDELLGKNTLNWEEVRGKKKRMYDLRATIIDLQLISKKNTELLLTMNLSMEEKLTGRPNQILKALNIDVDPRNMIRTQVEMFSEKVN